MFSGVWRREIPEAEFRTPVAPESPVESVYLMVSMHPDANYHTHVDYDEDPVRDVKYVLNCFFPFGLFFFSAEGLTLLVQHSQRSPTSKVSRN
jgi:hypothetical protein